MIRKVISIVFLGIALLQWFIIGERTVNAFWMWFKFKDYGGGGYTTMNLETLIAGYAISIAIIPIVLLTQKYFTVSPAAARINKTAMYMLAAGLLWLTALLLTPMVKALRK